MKTFFTVFLAILAAAAVISAGLAAKSRLDKWNKAKMECLDEISSMSQAIKDISDEPRSSDPEVALDELSIAMRNMKKAQGRINKAEEVLVSLLKNKPFGLPLTKDETEMLRGLTSALTPTTTTTEATAARTPDAINYDTKIHPENIILDAPTPSLTNKTTSEATSTPPTSTPTMETVTLTKPVSVQLESGTVTLPIGTKLEFVSQVGPKVHVRYLNSDQMIPISATDLK
jgi:hypothetical protein